MRERIAVVGGGITGLAAAYDLERLTDAEIDLYEASDRLGGKLRTDRTGGLLVEGGPDCFFARKPGVLELVRELGLEGELIAPQAGEFSMLVGGALHRVPRGLVNLAAPDPEAIRGATFLSEEAKSRALAPEPVSETDPSIRGFFAARYGPEFSRLVAEPLLAGTHGGDPARLSMRALYPAYLNPSPLWGRGAGVRGGDGKGGVAHTTATPTLPSPKGEAQSATFLSFRDGMGALPAALAARLQRTRVHLGTALERLPEADRTLVALPANRAAALLPGVGLDAIPHRSSAVVTLAFRRRDVGRVLDGTGFLVPPGEPAPVAGATWSSAKWPGRAPEGTVLMRAFLKHDPPSPLRGRGDGGEGLEALRKLLGLRGEPIHQRTDRWPDALPQYEIGHLDRIQSIEQSLPANVWLAGTSYRGVGVPDALRQGREAARRIAETL